MTINRQWLLAARPHGMVGPDNFSYREAPLESLATGQVLVRNKVFSFDPTQRNWMVDRPSYLPPVALGEVMRAGNRRRGCRIKASRIFRRRSRSNHRRLARLCRRSAGPRPHGPNQTSRGRQPRVDAFRAGDHRADRLFRNARIGRTQGRGNGPCLRRRRCYGSVAGQIARIKGCRVVGIAGGSRKCDWLKEQAGFDEVIDYKSEDVAQRIAETCPEKWDVFFDNVGGPILEAALNHLNLYSRIVLCGGIANYNAIDPVPGPNNLMNLVTNRGRMQGFIILDYLPRALEAVDALLGWVGAGELAYEVDVQEGFENIPKTLQRLYTGENFGKQLLRL